MWPAMGRWWKRAPAVRRGNAAPERPALDAFCRSKWLKSEIESEAPLPDVPADAKRTVEEWQKILLLWDPNCLPTFGADGKYGDETDAALRAMIEDAEAFRRANGR